MMSSSTLVGAKTKPQTGILTLHLPLDRLVYISKLSIKA